MQKNTYSGKFIVFEGLDGSGQTTQSELLKGFLISKGYSVIVTKEPTLYSEAGKKIREILDQKETISPKEFQELFAQDRKEHLKNSVIPGLQQGIWVVSDRYFFSSFAYGVTEGVNLEYLVQINNEFLLPDITFFLKVSSEVCLARIERRGKLRTYFETKEHFEKAWKVFESLAEHFENVHIVNGEQSIEKVAQDIQEIITT